MILKKLELSNYRTHRSLSKTFDGNLIAILGSNGSGKSSFLGAIQFALTGEQPGEVRKDLVSWGEKEGFVRLEFEHAGHSCAIRRSISSPACSLEIDGERINGAKAVEAAMAERFGVDKDLFRQVVFVRQAEVDAILFDEPRARELAFQRLAGLGDTEKMYNVLGGIVTKYDKPDSYDTWLDDAERSLKDTRAKSDELATRIGALELELAKLPQKRDMLESLSQLQSAIGTEKQRKELRERIDATAKAFEAAKKNLEELQATAPDSRTADDLRAEISSIDGLVAVRKRIDDAEEGTSSAAKAVEAAMAVDAPSAEDVAKAEADLASDREKMAAAANRVLTLEDYIRVVNGSGSCPVCGSTLSFDLDGRLRAELQAAKAEHADIEQRVAGNQCAYMRRSLEARESGIRLACARLDAAKALVLSARAAYENGQKEPPPLHELEDRRRAVHSVLAARASWESSVRDAQNAVSSAAASLDALGRSVPADGEPVDVEKLSEQAAVISKGILKYDETSTILATLQGTARVTAEQVSASEKYIEDLRAKKALADETKKRLEVLSTVRRALHYTAIPRTLSQKIVDRLTDGVNDYLDLFSAPFSVEPASEGVGFVCRFTDGRPMPEELPGAKALSGGQKVQLACAFRFATYGLFAPKLGLLALDEPTAYLDDSAVGRFGDVLKKVMEAARAMNVQVLCATHHQQVSAQADQTIQF